MDQPNVLRETKMGQKGFVKEDVLMYIDELNSQNEELKKELEKSSGSAADPQEIIKYRNQIDNLQEKLNASNNALRQAKKENEDLQQQISKLKAGGAAPAAGGANIDAQTKAALEAARKEIDSLRAQLKAANEKNASAPAQAPEANNAALDAAKKEIDTLKAQLKAAAEKAEKPAAVDNKSAEELAKANEQITKITAELKSKTDELDSVKRTVSEKDSKIDELTKAKDEAVKKGEEAAKKDEEIAKLNAEIADLKANSNDPAAIMGSLFAEAQRTVSQLKLQAEQEANRTTKDADDKAAAVVREANMTAEKTIREANMAAEKAIAEANMKAKMTVEDANSKAGKINEMSSTVRSMLLNEIESVNSKFNDITTSLMKLTGQATDRMGDAKMIIEEAKKAVAPSDENSVKLAEAPKASFSAAKAPTAEINKDDSKPVDNSDPFSRVAGGSYNSRNSSNNYNNNNFNNNKPSAPDAQKQAPKKPVSNFNFDMSDLLKAAEEEAAKEEV